MERRWAVLRSQPRRERIAVRAVKTRGVDTYLPLLRAERESELPRPLFPGYFFANVCPDSDDLLRIRSAPGVAYVLPCASTPALLPDLLIESIRSQEKAQNASSRTPGFRSGDPVVVVSGPLKWVEGLFDRRVGSGERVRILLNLVHGSLAVQIRASELKQAGSVPR